jgi:hypothetical protein
MLALLLLGRQGRYQMTGSLNEILPDPISEADERILLDLLKRKMTVMADIAVEILRAMEREFGPRAREVVRAMIAHQEFDARPDVGRPEMDLREFCALAEKMASGTHTWIKEKDELGSVSYKFTRCIYAEIFRELEEPELGLIMCARDEPWVKSFNPKLAFRRTRTLMNGDEDCDNTYYVDS